MKKLILVLLFITQLFATNYYVSNAGDDANNGTTTETTWRTIYNINQYSFVPGDSILFKKGDSWRNTTLQIKSGNSTDNIFYSSYGNGDKPILYGSYLANSFHQWKNTETSNVWEFLPHMRTGSNQIADTSFVTGVGNWYFYVNGSYATATMTHNAGEYMDINCTDGGTDNSHIQLVYNGNDIIIEKFKFYRLSFSAKSTGSSSPVLHLSNLEYEDEKVQDSSLYVNSTEWNDYRWIIYADSSLTNARLRFYLGGNISDGSVLSIDNITFEECENSSDKLDIGNIVFNSTDSVGVKEWTSGGLTAQGDFYYDEENHTLFLYSVGIPSTTYSNIELCVTKNIILISSKSYVTIDNLHLKNGSAHGINGATTSNITINDCVIEYIGGGDQRPYPETGDIRYGNGIEFWGNASSNTVTNNYINQIYDAGVTNQNNTNTVTQENIIYSNNVIKNCEYSYEYFNRPAASTSSNIQFTNNTCIGSGYGWGNVQRPSPNSCHIMIWESTAEHTNISIQNNIFYNSKNEAVKLIKYSNKVFNDISELTFNYNVYEPNASIIYFGITYTIEEFKNEGVFETNYIPALYSEDNYPSDPNDWLNFHSLTLPVKSGTVGDTITLPILMNLLTTDDAVKVYSFELEHDENIEIIDYDLTGALTNTSFRMNFHWTQDTKYSFGSYGINKLLTSVQDTLMSIKAVLLESGTCDLNLSTKFNNSALSISNNAGTITIEE